MAVEHKKTYLKADRREPEDTYVYIAKAAVRQAVADWIWLVTQRGWPNWVPRRIKKEDRDKSKTKEERQKERREQERYNIEDWILSEDFKLFTDIDGEKLMDFLEEKYILKRAG